MVIISNFTYNKGGLWSAPVLAEIANFEKDRRNNAFVEFFFIGAVFCISFYHMALYWMRRKDLSSLIFSIYCIAVAVRIISLSTIFYTIFGENSTALLKVRVEFIGYTMGMIFFALFIYNIFKEDFPKKLLFINTVPFVIYFIIIIFTPIYIFDELNRYYNYLSIFFTLSIFIVVVKAYLKNRDGASIIIFGYLILMYTAINDILKSMGLINTPYLISFGLFMFILFQAFIISYRFSKAYKTIEEMTEKLISIEKAKLDAMVTFSKAIVHELRTPISVIKGFANIEKNKRSMEEATKKRMEIIIKETDRVDEMATDLLEYAGAQEYVYNLEKIRVREIVDKVLGTKESEISSNKIKIENEKYLKNKKGELRMKRKFIGLVLALVLAGGTLYAEDAKSEKTEVKKEFSDETITEKDLMEMLEKAVKLLKEKGDEGLKEISVTKGEFHHGALYAFVYDENVNIIAHPEKPGLIGQNFKGKPDAKGRKFRDEIVAKALEGGGWTEYIYSKPDSTGLFVKKVYSKLAEKDGKKYIVAVGMYGGKAK